MANYNFLGYTGNNINSKNKDEAINYIKKYLQKNINATIEDEELNSEIIALDERSFINEIDDFASKNINIDRISKYKDYEQMEKIGFIGRSLVIYTASILQKNYENKLIIADSDIVNNKLIIDDLIKRLNLENSLWSIVYDTLKFGDCFVKIILNSDYNPKYIKKIEIIENPAEVTKIYDERDKENKKFVGYIYNNKFYFPYQILHFKLGEKEYGVSAIENSRLPYKYYKLLRDFIIIYRLERGVEKSVINVPVGNMSKAKIDLYMQKIKEAFRKRNIVDASGNLNTSLNPSSFFERYYIPVRDNSQAVTVNQLPAGQAIQTLDDFKALREEMIIGLNIPNAYLGLESAGEMARASLAQLDINFARLCENRQNDILKILYKLFYLELIFQGALTRNNYNSFTVNLPSVSDLNEKNEIETMQMRLGLVSQLLGMQVFPIDWVLKKYMKLSNKDLLEIKLMLQAQNSQVQQQQTQPAETGMLGGIPSPTTPEIGGEMPTGEMPTGEMPMETPMTAETPMPAEGMTPAETGGNAAMGGETTNLNLNASKIIKYLKRKKLQENKNPYLPYLWENGEFNGITYILK